MIAFFVNIYTRVEFSHRIPVGRSIELSARPGSLNTPRLRLTPHNDGYGNYSMAPYSTIRIGNS